MVKIQGSSDYERLDTLVRELAEQHGLQVDVTGWTRKTYDVFLSTGRRDPRTMVARVESFATTSGEIVVYDDEPHAFALALGAALEEQFGIEEAVLVKQPRPS